jgi:hypothetical protein
MQVCSRILLRKRRKSLPTSSLPEWSHGGTWTLGLAGCWGPWAWGHA